MSRESQRRPFGWIGTVCAGVLLTPTVIAQTEPNTVQNVPPISMPMDRAEDSYTIYSQLMPGDEFRSSIWPRKLWLIENTTTAAPLVEPCKPVEGDRHPGLMVNPHNAISAPLDRIDDLMELLKDYDQHCHDRIRLDAAKFHLPVPLRLLNEKQRKRFQGSRLAERGKRVPPEFDGAPGVNSFSEVYFNAAHTLALVHAAQSCGTSCGNWYWTVLERKDGAWHTLPWVNVTTVS